MRRVFGVLLIAALAAGAPAAQARASERHRRLPVREVPASGGDPGGRVVAVLLTGDGGIGHVGRQVSQRLSEYGIPVVALNSFRYFLRRRDPQEAARDVEGLIDRYRDAWGKDRVVLVGYSLGADVLPFIVNRMSDANRRRIDAVALLAPERSVDFKFHLSYWLPWGRHRYSFSVADEAAKLSGPRVLCVQGEKETASLCRAAAADRFTVASTAGGHHFARHYGEVADWVAEETLGAVGD